jgi:hypothetical protein
MDTTLSSEALTEALAEVKSRIRDGLVTANSRDVPEKSREVIADSYARFKAMMNEIVGHLGMSSKGLHLKMGRYAPNGKYKPHLWCAIIPVTVRAPSYFTTQLYIFRSDAMLGWGIGPSDKAQENEEFMAAYRGAMKSNEATVRELFSQGFVSREDFEERQGRHDKRFSDDVSTFFGSNSQTLARVFLVKELPSGEKLPSMIEADLKKLLPLYVKIVEACTNGNLIQRLNQAENGEDTDVEDVDTQVTVAWLEKWNEWFDGPNNPEAQREVPEYLKSEFGTAWKTFRQRWEIGRRESLLSLKEPNEDRVHALLFGSLQRTQFTGAWRTPLEKGYPEIVKAINDFAEKYPTGCSNDNFKTLVAVIEKITGFELKAFISRTLCDIRPNVYLPYGNFIVDALKAAAPMLGSTANSSLRKDDYEAICKEARRLVALFPDLEKETALYIFDHFLSWVNKQYEASTTVAGPEVASSKSTLRATEPLTLDQLFEATAKTKVFIEAVERRLSEKKQAILFGPPGTSKTHFARLFARYFHGGSSVMTSIQFHPSYSYEDFIEGYRPNGTQFEVKPGVFMEFCESARNDPDRRYVFLIDEVNRGNLAQIFGELLYLLEYRDEEVVLTYSKRPFSIPKNVYIVATMNSADRSIAMVDYALRRRFDFIELPADETVLREYLKKHECSVSVEKVIGLFQRVNSAVTSELGKHYAVGHTYFMKPNLTEERLRDTWKYSIEPLLEEYFFSNTRLLESLTFEALWSGGQGESKVA